MWKVRRNAYAKKVGEDNKEKTGSVFLNRINDVLKELGKWYDGPTKFNTPPGKGDDKQDAFEGFAKYLGDFTPESSRVAWM